MAEGVNAPGSNPDIDGSSLDLSPLGTPQKTSPDNSKTEESDIADLSAKKQRGRAAPPGRCHSCNRAETPEWRRGPDGARTLCNACGLHYAKLTRKNRLKPISGDDNASGPAGGPLRPDVTNVSSLASGSQGTNRPSDKVYDCEKCSFESTTLHGHIDHALSHARRAVTRCTICDIHFQSDIDYETHFRQHAQQTRRISSEIVGSAKLDILSPQKRSSWSNRIKRAIERFTGAQWDWWPLEPCQTIPTSRFDCLHWQCSCGDDRFEEVSKIHAEILINYARSSPANVPVSNQQSQTSTGNAQTPVIHNEGSTQGGDKISPNPTDVSIPPNPYSGTSLTSRAASIQATTELYNPIQLHVLLSVPIGSDISLKHIDITDFNDEKFFRSLQLAYLDAKGLFRRTLGVWQYSHCNFYKFEKFDENEIAPRGPGIPSPDNQEYQYNPKPVKEMPPITEHEFRNRFYACHGRCLPALFGLRNPFHRCRKACRYSPEAVNRVPKRLWPLEMGGDARETFWGLFVVENISFLRVAIFHAIVIVPALVFWFLWLFYWDHSGDLQNASVPFLCALGVISLFWYPLYGGRAGVGVQ